MTKDDLKDGMEFIDRGGLKKIIIGSRVFQYEGKHNLKSVRLDWVGSYHLDMTDIHGEFPEYDIMQVSYNGELLWTRPEPIEPTEEMTLKQVCEALGKDIKIVK